MHSLLTLSGGANTVSNLTKKEFHANLILQTPIFFTCVIACCYGVTMKRLHFDRELCITRLLDHGGIFTVATSRPDGWLQTTARLHWKKANVPPHSLAGNNIISLLFYYYCYYLLKRIYTLFILIFLFRVLNDFVCIFLFFFSLLLILSWNDLSIMHSLNSRADTCLMEGARGAGFAMRDDNSIELEQAAQAEAL